MSSAPSSASASASLSHLLPLPPLTLRPLLSRGEKEEQFIHIVALILSQSPAHRPFKCVSLAPNLSVRSCVLMCALRWPPFHAMDKNEIIFQPSKIE